MNPRILSNLNLYVHKNENRRGQSNELRERQLESVAFFTPKKLANSVSLDWFRAFLRRSNISEVEKFFILCKIQRLKFCSSQNVCYLCNVFQMERAVKDTKFGADRQILTVKQT